MKVMKIQFVVNQNKPFTSGGKIYISNFVVNFHSLDNYFFVNLKGYIIKTMFLCEEAKLVII